jgi:two-component system response regulator AtoC
LFLDEVGTMPMPLQMKMLRVLQEREFERIGDTRTIKVDVRIVAATNADLSKMVKEGSFREDLYYRLNVIPVHIAPLRERVEDIPLLVQTFVKKFAPDRDVTVAQDAMRRLMAYAWPGNVRQLENAIERAIAMSGSRTQIDVADLPADLQVTGETMTKPLVELPVAGVDLPELIAQIEKDMIGRALTRTEQNKGAAARLLGLKRTTLVEKLKRF